MSEAELPERQGPGRQVTVEDVRQLMGASSPHFALQLRNRIARLVGDLPADHPARTLGEQEIDRLNSLARTGEVRGRESEPAFKPLPSVDDGAARGQDVMSPVDAT